MTLCQRDVQLIGDAAAKSLLHEVGILLHNLDLFSKHREPHLHSAQIEIAAGYIGDERNQHHVARRNCGFHVVLRGLDGTPVFAEHVDFPGGVEPDEIVDLADARPVLGGDQSLARAPAAQIASRADAPAFAAP